MNNSMMDDYFSFMSNRGTGKPTQPRVSQRPAAALQSDLIDFVAEPPAPDGSPIEVIESLVSDTLIERLFRRRADG